MKPPAINELVMFDRRDGDPVPGSPAFCIRFNDEGKEKALAVWETEWPSIYTGCVMAWDKVLEEPKLYGFTEKQAIEAAAQEVEF